MTEFGESIAIPGAGSGEDAADLVACDWKDCTTNHMKKPSYPGGGNLERNGSYAKDWVNAGLEPWELYGPGTSSQATLSEYQAETPAARYATTAAALTHPEYHTQKHHLISVNLFGGVPDLAHNARLIGYDANHANNGSCFPSYVLDIVQHDLQCHRGQHPKVLYNDKIRPLLANLENRCRAYCKIDIGGEVTRQSDLMKDLNRLSVRIYSNIKAWKYLLRKNALAERDQSNERLEGLGG